MSALVARIIATRRLDLVPLRVEHAEEMAGVLADPALHAFTGGEPYGPDALRARYRRLCAGSPDPAVTWLNWVVLLRDEARLAGTVQATVARSGHGPAADTADTADPAEVAEVAWVVGTPWQGRGIATEAARGLAAWLGPEVDAVVAHIHPDHHASAAVARAAGLGPTDEWHDGEIRWSDTYARRPGT